MLRFSPLFQVESFRIDNCRLTQEFFNAYPGMADDIMVAEEEPVQIFGIDDHNAAGVGNFAYSNMETDRKSTV